MQRFYQYNGGVAVNFDLNLLPFYRIKGQEWPQLPGLLAMLPPRHSARGREDDRLVIYLSFSGTDPFSSSDYKQTASMMAQRFYQTAGTVTAAIRATAESLNQMLLERNLRNTGNGQYIIGRLILGVLRGSQFLVAQCGPTHVFQLTGKETRQIHDAQISGRGMGIGMATPLYLSQLDLAPGEQLMLCADLPSGWQAALQGKSLISSEALRRELVSITTDDLNAILVQVQAGKGNLKILKVPPSSVGSAARMVRQPVPVEPAIKPAYRQVTPDLVSAPVDQAAETAPTQAHPTSKVESGRPASRFASLLAGVGVEPTAATPNPEPPLPTTLLNSQNTPAKLEPSIAIDAPRPQSSTVKSTPSIPTSIPNLQNNPAKPARQVVPGSKNILSRPTSQAGRFVSARPAGELPEIKRPPVHRQNLLRGLAKGIQGIRVGMQGLAAGVGKFLPNLFPNTKEGEGEVGGGSLVFMAIAIPVLVVTIAGLFYTRYGRVKQFEDYYTLAYGQAAQAHGQTDPLEVRRAWESTLYYLEIADTYQVTQESLDLRQQAQAGLDNLDGIVRLDFLPAIAGGLSRSVQISRMAATNTDLYLLDGVRGSVMRATLGSQGYEIDTNFECGPGQYDTIKVGNLIDVEALQMSNDYNARVMAIDASGNLLYCGFNMQPVAVPLSPPPLGWQDIFAFTLDTDGKVLYVLDPPGNTVWVYQGDAGKFIDSPDMFFSQQVPQNMSSSIDLAANKSDLYLLFEDGHVTACPANNYEGVPMRCADPLTYIDNRPERKPSSRITDAVFTQITFAAAPDPLLYLLEPLTKAIYYFSPRSDSLELRGQFRAGVEQSNKLTGTATGMTISPNRNIFFSISSEVYFSTNVP
jgi:hypothetical protein